MIGHGRPRITHGVTLAVRASVAALLLWHGLDSRCPAQDNSPEAVRNGEAAQTPTQNLLDDATGPFEFRSTNPDWPFVDVGDTGLLSVRIRSLPQYADRDLELVYELVRVQDGAVVGREQTGLRLDRSGDSDSIAIASTAPAEAGVYEIRCSVAEKSDRIWSRLTRGSNELASTNTPWMVFESRSDPTTDLTAEASSRSTVQWREVGPIHRIDPDSWQRPAWMPSGATKLVPNVKRVSESLTLPPWRDSQQVQSHQLAAGESFVGALEQIKPHQTYQLSIKITESEFGSESTSVQIDFAQSPDFDTVTRTVKLDGGRRLDVSSQGIASERTYDVLYFAGSENEFVRINNNSSETNVTIESVILSQPDQTGSESKSLPPPRPIGLSIRSHNWLRELESDYAIDSALGQYAESTQAMFRIWNAVLRLNDHAAWYGYDEINLPLDVAVLMSRDSYNTFGRARLSASTSTSGPSDADQSSRGLPVADLRIPESSSWHTTGLKSQAADSLSAPVPPPGAFSPAMKWASAHAAAAMSRWSQSSALRIFPRLPRNHYSDDGLTVDFNRHSRNEVIDGESTFTPRIELLDLLAGNVSRPVSLRLIQLPLACDRSFRETVSHFRYTPKQIVAMPSSQGGESEHIHVLIPSPAHDASVQPTATLPITVINTAPWTSHIRMRFATPDVVECVLVHSEATHSVVAESETSDTRLLTIGPSSVVRMQVRGNGTVPRLTSWQGSMVGGGQTLEVLKGRVSEVVGKIGTLALPEDYDELRNPSFEIDGQVGIVGWMHTQFPSSAVTRDSDEAIDGSHSIRLSADANSAGRIWLVSEPIAVPRSGRIAVSLAVRAGKQTATAKSSEPTILKSGTPPKEQRESTSHRVRVSLEGNRMGKPVRFSTEFDVPCDGQWQPRRIVLEAEGVNQDEIEFLRLTIDSLSTGKLWIDDIHLHDRFPTEAERTALKGTAFLAIQGLQRGSLKPAAGLLNNEWSLYLLDQADRNALAARKSTPRNRQRTGPWNTFAPTGVTMDSEPTASPAPDAATTPENARRASVAERLRDWLPKPIRF